MINGQDWASYQGPNPDPAGLDFVFIKVTQGLNYINPYWQQQVEVARRAGAVIGLYHYPDMRNGAGVECQHFCTVAANALSADMWGSSRMAMLDWEGYDRDNQGVSHAAQAAYKDAFLEHLGILRPHNRSVLYANLDYWRNIDTTGKFGEALFIATAGRQAGHPGIATPWLFHQFGTNRGVDQDVANFPSRAALAAWTRKQEADMPLTPEDVRSVWGYSHIGQDGHADAPDVHQTLQNAQDQARAANEAVHQLSLQVATMETTLNTVKAAVQQPAGGATAAELQAAAEAGAEAAINKFLASLTIKPASATV